jgi:DNA-binding transcriptional MerR regulator
MALKPEIVRLYKPGEVAEKFRVDIKTVARWDRAGKLGPTVRTIGLHRRYDADYIDALLAGTVDEATS